MRNNKWVTTSELQIGTRIKVAVPSVWAEWYKDKDKKYTWFFGKVVEVYPNGAITVNLRKPFVINNMMCPFPLRRIIKTL